MSEVVNVDEQTVKCDGRPLDEKKNGLSQGHPAVYLKINQESKAECPYCGRVFIYNKSEIK